MSDDELAAAQAESDAIDLIEGDDRPMHFRADGSLYAGLTEVLPTPAPELYTLDNPGYGRTVHFEHEGRVVSGTVRGIVSGGGRHRVTVFSTDLGHTHTIDHGVTVDVADLLPAPPAAPSGTFGAILSPADALPAPAPTLADETPEQRAARHALNRPLIEAFDALPAPAPTLADDVAALRLASVRYGDDHEYSLILDRIAGAVPQRAVRNNGRAMWQHSICGSVMAFRARPLLCNCCRPGTWQALYVLGNQP